MNDLAEVRLCTQALVMVVATVAFVELGVSPEVSLVALSGGLAVVCLRQPPSYAVLLAVTAWCLLTGFVVNDVAELTLRESDLVHLAVLLGAAAAGCRAGAWSRSSRTVTPCPTPTQSPWPSGSSTHRSPTTSRG